VSLIRKKKAPSQAEQIVLAAAAKARVELLIGEMSSNLLELRDIIVEGKAPNARPES